MSRINIPKNPDQFVALCQGIVVKHAKDGANSPLTALNMAEMDTKATTADTQNKTSAKLYRDAETATQNRDLAIGKNLNTAGTVNYYVAAVRDVLLGLYKGNEQKLGDWGFEVSQSAAASPKAVPPAK